MRTLLFATAGALSLTLGGVLVILSYDAFKLAWTLR